MQQFFFTVDPGPPPPKELRTYPGDRFRAGGLARVVGIDREVVEILFREEGPERYWCRCQNGDECDFFVWQLEPVVEE